MKILDNDLKNLDCFRTNFRLKRVGCLFDKLGRLNNFLKATDYSGIFLHLQNYKVSIPHTFKTNSSY